ncbi:MAG: hypothetical protein V7749_14910 [Cocleimonas sp.]
MRHISTTALSKKLGVSSRELFEEFEKLEWITAERNLTVDGFSVGGIYKEIKKEGETFKYIAWPENIQLGIKPQEIALITATALGKVFELSAIKMNYILAEIAWSKKGEFNKGWIATEHGLGFGAVQAEDTKSGVPYIRWPETIADNEALISTVADFKGQLEAKIIDPDILTFRERFPAKYRATDGHMTRSKAEALIDNWLYMLEIAHAYERKLPLEEEMYASFYIPHGKVYIEYFGCDNDDAYGYDKNCQRRKQEKLDIYEKYALNLIELEDKDIDNLDNVLPKMLLKFGVQTY